MDVVPFRVMSPVVRAIALTALALGWAAVVMRGGTVYRNDAAPPAPRP